MTKPHVVLIHGMGTHSQDSTFTSFTTPLDAATAHFRSMNKISDSVELHYIDYNGLLEEIRAHINEATLDDLQTKFPGAPSLITKINDLNGKFGEADSFFYTHWLDVLLYRSYYADAIQIRVGKQLVEAMKAATDDAADIHIVCHSLGCAVMNDTLHKLYVNSLNDELGRPLLSAGLNKIRSITMVANVSQLPITQVDPYASVVKPGPNGICDYFLTCRHVLDPIASLIKFDPGANWPKVQGSVFRNVAINKVERANVHDLDHYLADPKVYLPFFFHLFPLQFNTNNTELTEARAAHAATTFQGRFDKLRDTIENADISLYWDEDDNEFVFSPDVASLHEQIIAFRDHLKAIEGQINAISGGDNE